VRILLDTGILIRNADLDDPLQAEVAAALDRLVDGGRELCIVNQNLYEFWVAATRPAAVRGFGFTADRAAAAIYTLITSFTLLDDTPAIRDTWLDLCTRYGVLGRQGHDVRLVAAMLCHGVSDLPTLNAADFRRYAEIRPALPSDIP
jgi:predicted nucleic acid-binding protein